METLEELKEKYSKLDKERDIVYNKILELEDQEMLKEFTASECYLDTWNDTFKKIIAVDCREFYCICVDEDSIYRESVTLESTRGWKKITSEQFDSMLNAVLKDLQDTDLENEKESNWNKAFKAVIESNNKEK